MRHAIINARSAVQASPAHLSVKRNTKPLAVAAFASAARFSFGRQPADRTSSPASGALAIKAPSRFPVKTSTILMSTMPDRPVATQAFKIDKVCIVGGGNAAQAMAALFPFKGIPCNMLVSLPSHPL